jgi:Ca2+-dependent lipid-binding protein
VALVTIKQARDLPNMESLGNFFNQDNVSDPFARILLEDGTEVAKTNVKEDTLSPIWNESFYVLIPPHNDFITLQILHESTIGNQFIGQYKSKIPMDEEKIEG